MVFDGVFFRFTETALEIWKRHVKKLLQLLLCLDLWVFKINSVKLNAITIIFEAAAWNFLHIFKVRTSRNDECKMYFTILKFHSQHNVKSTKSRD